MIKKILGAFLLLSIMAVSFTACEKKEPSVSSVPVMSEGPLVSSTKTTVSLSKETSTSVSTETSVSETPAEEETVKYILYVINQCKADIGMVSLLDPYDGTQINVGELTDGTALTFNFEDWPVSAKSIDLAFYNVNGELVSSTSVNIEGVKSKVTVLLSGEGNIDNVEGRID